MLINARMPLQLCSLQIQTTVLLGTRSSCLHILKRKRSSSTFLNSASTLVMPIHEAVIVLYSVERFVIVRILDSTTTNLYRAFRDL